MNREKAASHVNHREVHEWFEALGEMSHDEFEEMVTRGGQSFLPPAPGPGPF